MPLPGPSHGRGHRTFWALLPIFQPLKSSVFTASLPRVIHVHEASTCTGSTHKTGLSSPFQRVTGGVNTNVHTSEARRYTQSLPEGRPNAMANGWSALSRPASALLSCQPHRLAHQSSWNAQFSLLQSPGQCPTRHRARQEDPNPPERRGDGDGGRADADELAETPAKHGQRLADEALRPSYRLQARRLKRRRCGDCWAAASACRGRAARCYR